MYLIEKVVSRAGIYIEDRKGKTQAGRCGRLDKYDMMLIGGRLEVPAVRTNVTSGGPVPQPIGQSARCLLLHKLGLPWPQTAERLTFVG